MKSKYDSVQFTIPLGRMGPWLASVPPWLLLLVGILGGGMVGLMFSLTKEATTAFIGLIGVGLGGVIAATTNLVTARAARRAQVVTATWPKRLEKHQEAFEQWRRIAHLTHFGGEERISAIKEAELWWNKNCLYLSGEAQRSFKMMLIYSDQHLFLSASYKIDKDVAILRAVKENWQELIEVGEIIARAAGSHLSDEFLNELKKKAIKNP